MIGSNNTRKTLVKLLGALIAFVVLVLVADELTMHPPFIKALDRLHLQMKIVGLAAEAYARKHDGKYPLIIDQEFDKEVSDWAQTKRRQWKATPEWLVVATVHSKADAVQKATFDLGKEKVIYCVLMNDQTPIGFYILGKDGNGKLLNGVVRGVAQHPLIISKGDAEATN